VYGAIDTKSNALTFICVCSQIEMPETPV